MAETTAVPGAMEDVASEKIGGERSRKRPCAAGISMACSIGIDAVQSGRGAEGLEMLFLRFLAALAVRPDIVLRCVESSGWKTGQR